MEQNQSVEDIIQRCIEQLRRGASVEELLLAHPEQAPLIEPALRSAQTLLTLPRAAATDEARGLAMQRMLGQLAAAPASAPRAGWFGAFLQRSRAFQAAAVAGGIALFSVAGMGAAAATGAGPEPVREFFGLSESQVKIEFEGVVVSVEPGNNTLDVSAGGTIRTITVDASTELSDGGDSMSLDDFAAGDVVEVKGSLQADGTVLATRVHLDDGDDASATPDPSPEDDITPEPTRDDAGDDNRGHGNDDDHDDEDNPGQGNGSHGADDDGDDGSDDDDRSGAGGGDEDDDGDDKKEDDDEDNSGPGGGDDDNAGDDDDNSGPGGGGNDDDDNSGPGSDDDDDGDDDDNSGPGGADDDGGSDDD